MCLTTSSGCGRDLTPVGRSAASGGYFRQPFATAERELDAWFVEQAAARGLRLETDALRQPGRVVGRRASGAAWAVRLTGSHLDSVLDGGAYDGPLGVVSALAAVDLLRERGLPAGPADRGLGVRRGGGVAVRAGLPRLAAGDRRDRLGAGPRAARPGRRTAGRGDGRAGLEVENPQPWLGSDASRCFVELHVEQGRDLVDRGAAVGVASRIWPHGRYRFDITGDAEPRRARRGWRTAQDPMLTYAMTALAANKQARVAGQRATFGRVETTPNSTNSVPSRGDRLAGCALRDRRRRSPTLVATITRQAEERAARDGTTLAVTAESVSGAVDFDAGLARRIAADHEGGDWPVIPTAGRPRRRDPVGAGDPDARCCSSATRPASRTRRPSTPRSPDCLAGVDALAETLERLAT